MSGDLRRVSLTIPPDLLEEFDAVVADWEYDSRSEAMRDALREFLVDYRWRTDLTGRRFGSVVLLYDHHVSGVTDAMLDLQHAFADTIVSVQHVHLTDDLCLETLVVDGTGEDIQHLVNRLKSLRGIQQVRLAVTG